MRTGPEFRLVLDLNPELFLFRGFLRGIKTELLVLFPEDYASHTPSIVTRKGKFRKEVTEYWVRDPVGRHHRHCRPWVSTDFETPSSLKKLFSSTSGLPPTRGQQQKNSDRRMEDQGLRSS